MLFKIVWVDFDNVEKSAWVEADDREHAEENILKTEDVAHLIEPGVNMFLRKVSDADIQSIVTSILNNQREDIVINKISVIREDNGFVKVPVIFDVNDNISPARRNIKDVYFLSDFDIHCDKYYVSAGSVKLYRKMLFDILGNDYASTYLLESASPALFSAYKGFGKF